MLSIRHRASVGLMAVATTTRDSTDGLIRMVGQLQLFMAVTLIALATPLGAQNKTAPTMPAGPKTGKAQIVGVVVDSLNGRYLSGADVVVEGARATLQTDSLGRF